MQNTGWALIRWVWQTGRYRWQWNNTDFLVIAALAFPYLFKVLDVKEMLSIQVHPSKAAAEKEFARENAEGIPLDSPHRNYKDDNHKPEMMVALSDFWLLHGLNQQKN